MEIVFAGNPTQAALVQGVLEDSGIPARLSDEFIGTMAPWYVAPGGAGAVKVVVANENAERARAVLESSHLELEAPELTESDEEIVVDSDIVTADYLVDRAFKCAIIGCLLFPGIMHWYSLSLLRRATLTGGETEAVLGKRRIAALIDILGIAVVLVLIIAWIGDWFG